MLYIFSYYLTSLIIIAKPLFVQIQINRFLPKYPNHLVIEPAEMRNDNFLIEFI